MVVDASALLAILLGEPDADQYLAKLLTAHKPRITPVNWWEVQITVRSRYGDAGVQSATEWMNKMGIEVEPISLLHAQLAAGAFAKYRGRPAKLNMGDCFAYALSKARDMPLLYKGNDFAHTDLQSA